MPLTTPAAQKGIHIIWTAHIAMPPTPNRATLMNASSVGPQLQIGTPPMADAIDHAGGPEGNPHHLDCPYRHAADAEQSHADERQQRRTPIADRNPTNGRCH